MATTLGNARRILFIRTDRLGETILNLPAVSALKAALPGSSVTLLVHPDLQPLLAHLPIIDQVMACPTVSAGAWWLRAWQLARLLKPHRFDVAVVSNPKKELHAAVRLAGIPRRVGYNRKWGWLLTDRLPDRKALGDRHEVQYNLDLVRALGLPVSVPQWQWPPFERERSDVRQLLAQQRISLSEPFVAIHPWSSNPRKEWPAERFQELIRRLTSQTGLRVVVIGGPDERRQVPAVLPQGAAAADLVGRLTLTQLAALLQCAALLVSNDSGPVHLAASVGTPTVVLFGSPDDATGPRRWGPWPTPPAGPTGEPGGAATARGGPGGSGHVVICQPSMDAISVDEVLASVMQRLR